MFVCSICGARFIRKKNAIIHLVDVHFEDVAEVLTPYFIEEED